MRSGHLVVETSAENHLHMALMCAAELRSAALAGPLSIGGNCQGALLAQKTAQLLMTSGRAVPRMIPARAARGNGPARFQRRANITTLPSSVSPRPRNAPGVQWKPS